MTSLHVVEQTLYLGTEVQRIKTHLWGGEGNLHALFRKERKTTKRTTPAKMPTIIAMVLPMSSSEYPVHSKKQKQLAFHDSGIAAW